MNLNQDRLRLLAESVILDNPNFKGHIDMVLESMEKLATFAVILAGSFPKEERHNITLMNGVCQDFPFMVSDAILKNTLSEALELCSQMRGGRLVCPVEEIAEVEEFYEKGFSRGLRIGGFNNFSEHLRIAKKELTIFTGFPGHGKSEFVDQLLIELAQQHKFKSAIFSPENYPHCVHYEKWISKKTGLPFHDGPRPRIKKEEICFEMGWVDEHFTMIQPHEDNICLDAILSLAKRAIDKRKIDLLLIDPWNELENARKDGQSETDHIGESLMKCRRFARMHDIALWIVAHPYKPKPNKEGGYDVPGPYSISGSAHWANKADNCVTVFRQPDKVTVYIQKVKFKMRGQIGSVDFFYDKVTGRYTELQQNPTEI